MMVIHEIDAVVVSLERELELLKIQEEYIRDEQLNLKREKVRAQEEVQCSVNVVIPRSSVYGVHL